MPAPSSSPSALGNTGKYGSPQRSLVDVDVDVDEGGRKGGQQTYSTSYSPSRVPFPNPIPKYFAHREEGRSDSDRWFHENWYSRGECSDEETRDDDYDETRDDDSFAGVDNSQALHDETERKPASYGFSGRLFCLHYNIGWGTRFGMPMLQSEADAAKEEGLAKTVREKYEKVKENASRAVSPIPSEPKIAANQYEYFTDANFFDDDSSTSIIRIRKGIKRKPISHKSNNDVSMTNDAVAVTPTAAISSEPPLKREYVESAKEKVERLKSRLADLKKAEEERRRHAKLLEVAANAESAEDKERAAAAAVVAAANAATAEQAKRAAADALAQERTALLGRAAELRAAKEARIAKLKANKAAAKARKTKRVEKKRISTKVDAERQTKLQQEIDEKKRLLREISNYAQAQMKKKAEEERKEEQAAAEAESKALEEKQKAAEKALAMSKRDALVLPPFCLDLHSMLIDSTSAIIHLPAEEKSCKEAKMKSKQMPIY